MSERRGIRYGTPNMELIGRWLQLAPEDDGPFWALNLMKYRAVAEYADGRESARSGREADDAYAPLGPLAAVGARVVLHGDVEEQSLGEPAWDRVGIVRYPSRAAFFAMQQRDDFKDLHEHKEAGMEFTIVMSTLPSGRPGDLAAPGEGSGGADPTATLVLTVQRAAVGAEPAAPDHPGVTPVAVFDVEGVIIGDERSWTQVRFDRVVGEDGLDAVRSAAAVAEEAFVVAVRPVQDDLLATIVEA